MLWWKLLGELLLGRYFGFYNFDLNMKINMYVLVFFIYIIIWLFFFVVCNIYLFVLLLSML